MFTYGKDLYEGMTPADICWIAELPYPFVNDLIMKQIARQQKVSDQMKKIGGTTVIKRRSR